MQRHAESAARGPRFARHGARGGTNHKRHTNHQAFMIGPPLAPCRRPSAAGHAQQTPLRFSAPCARTPGPPRSRSGVANALSSFTCGTPVSDVSAMRSITGRASAFNATRRRDSITTRFGHADIVMRARCAAWLTDGSGFSSPCSKQERCTTPPASRKASPYQLDKWWGVSAISAMGFALRAPLSQA